ncbi:hypothetical protein BDP81DRAFT_432839 [Colletotrichum phormii]|uniref:Uncharacterized protein n=1 Tax=Colletotrichum phormii TaxID=359342 RepID=A0AAJ0ED88_9PEZI|nr:uncharacterized protein BDP81DRAFT_432839 [Colletotrichum phormii]KAK1634448.1 hypothetical protein BDP81DRAFT_432839 [Colletotrichum phormii]
MRIGGKIGQNGTKWNRLPRVPPTSPFEASRGGWGHELESMDGSEGEGEWEYTSTSTFRKGQRLQVNSSLHLELRGPITRLLELGETVDNSKHNSCKANIGR